MRSRSSINPAGNLNTPMAYVDTDCKTDLIKMFFTPDDIYFPVTSMLEFIFVQRLLQIQIL
jgi:hypothetical protein